MNIGITVGDSTDRLVSIPSVFDFVEFSISEQNRPVEPAVAAEISSMLADRALELLVHLPYKQVVSTPVPELNDAIVAYQGRLLELAANLGATKAVLHATMRDPHDVEQRQQFGEQLERIKQRGEGVGVRVVVENVGHQRLGVPITVLGELADHRDIDLCFDIGHAYMENGNNIIDSFLNEFGELVDHLHIHDARSRGDTHLPVGAGEVDFSIVSKRLAGFDGTVAIEIFTDDTFLLTDSARRVLTLFEEHSESNFDPAR